jgi:hypothetical protein
MNSQMMLEISDGEVIMGGFEFTGDDILFACDGYAHPVIFTQKWRLGLIVSTKILFNAHNVYRSVSRRELEIMHASKVREILENELVIYRVHEAKVNEAKESWKNVPGAAVQESTASNLLSDHLPPVLGGLALGAFLAWLIS